VASFGLDLDIERPFEKLAGGVGVVQGVLQCRQVRELVHEVGTAAFLLNRDARRRTARLSSDLPMYPRALPSSASTSRDVPVAAPKILSIKPRVRA